MGLMNKLKDKIKDSGNLDSGRKPVAASPATSGGSSPSKRQIFQNRFNYGANLGSIFVLEKWITPSLFLDGAKGTSELTAVSTYVKEKGVEEAKKKWTDHFHNFINDDDWNWLKDHGDKAVRVPFGYWMVNGGSFCGGTPFEKYAAVYSDGWAAYKKIIEKAASLDIAVLVDFHALPGGANDGDHSGTDTKKVDFWGSSSNVSLAVKVLDFVAGDLKGYDNVCGIQIVNEAPYASNINQQKSYYEKAIAAIRSKNQDVPIVFSDGWDLSKWNDTIKEWEKPLFPKSLGIVVDTHVYRCFSDDDKNKAPSDHVKQMCGDNPIGKDDGVDALVGEWSCVLDGSTWDKLSHGQSRDEYCKKFGQAQCACFQKCSFAGAYFWTLKFEGGSWGEWDYKEMSGKNCVGFSVDFSKASKEEYERRKNDAVGGHTNYWNGVDGNKDWQHWRFEKGFDQGWADSATFAQHNSEIGRIVAWSASRFAEHIQAEGNNDVAWVYRHGFIQGVKQFREVIRS